MMENDRLRSENIEAVVASASADKNSDKFEPVGEILHRERVTRRITLDTIAKDLKLNSKYIKAIEESDYKSLPADPYVRVYLKSLASYLMLDPDEILNKFFEERGVEKIRSEAPGGKIVIDLKNDNNADAPSVSKILMIAGALIVFGVLATKLGLIKTGEVEKSTIGAVTDSTEQSSDTSVTIENYYDSIQDITDSLSDSSAVDSISSADTLSFATADVSSKKKITFTLTINRDSVWVQAYRDGKSWRNFMYAGDTRVFSATDSINIRLGNSSVVSCKYNGKPFFINRKGLAILSIKRDKIRYLTSKQWRKAFGKNS